MAGPQPPGGAKPSKVDSPRAAVPTKPKMNSAQKKKKEVNDNGAATMLQSQVRRQQGRKTVAERRAEKAAREAEIKRQNAEQKKARASVSAKSDMGLSEETLAAREKVAAEKEAEKKRKQAELDALNAAHKDNLAATGAKSDRGLSEEMLAAREKVAAEKAHAAAQMADAAAGQHAASAYLPYPPLSERPLERPSPREM